MKKLFYNFKLTEIRKTTLSDYFNSLSLFMQRHCNLVARCIVKCLLDRNDTLQHDHTAVVIHIIPSILLYDLFKLIQIVGIVRIW